MNKIKNLIKKVNNIIMKMIMFNKLIVNNKELMCLIFKLIKNHLSGKLKKLEKQILNN